MRVFNTRRGVVATEDDETWFAVPVSGWDELVCAADLPELLASARAGERVQAPLPTECLPPIGSQEVWAAGVTYYRSRSARMEESKEAGGGTFYDRVYSAQRPELFFKATARRVVGPGAAVRIRSDANWSVPEPELTLLINPRGKIIGYTAGNDMSSRDIEGENPLYLPQAKVYDGSCALGPCLLVQREPIAKATEIRIRIARGGDAVFAGATTLAELKREPQELAEYLYRDSSFPAGAYLMTGTGIVPGDDFTLQRRDEIEIAIDGIGVLRNHVG